MLFSQGLFSYQTWNGMDGFWQNGVVLETMANCLHYLNNTRCPPDDVTILQFIASSQIQECCDGQ